jgi:hypothetical protein
MPVILFFKPVAEASLNLKISRSKNSSSSRITESLPNSSSSDFIPESVKNFWKEAQSKNKTFFNALLDDIGTGKFTSLFKKNGGYAQLTENIKRKFLFSIFLFDYQ